MVNGIGQLRRSEGKKTWMAFLDFIKAFPNVWREGLWKKMQTYGIDGRFSRVCEKLYSNVGEGEGGPGSVRSFYHRRGS